MPDSFKTCSFIYKVCRQAEWEQARALAGDKWPGSADDVADGFVHFSTAAQLEGTLAKHFEGQGDLVLIQFAANDLGAALRWEPSRGGDLFPHLYGSLDMRLAKQHWPLKEQAGSYTVPAEVAA